MVGKQEMRDGVTLYTQQMPGRKRQTHSVFFCKSSDLILIVNILFLYYFLTASDLTGEHSALAKLSGCDINMVLVLHIAWIQWESVRYSN